jgi:membrane-bound inhibitor of C-type lysozyme
MTKQMAKSPDKNAWGKSNLATASILLDSQNPRIDAVAKTGQEQLRLLLLSTEKVVELANSIVRSGALFAGERIIVLRQGQRHIVLEGNRRVTACQVLLNPNLAPLEYRRRLLLPLSAELKQKIGEMEADVAPNREAAEAIITRRHTQPGIEQWSPIAKQRRIARMIESGATIEDVMERFDMTKGSVTRIVRDHEVLRQVKSLETWSADELKRLDDPKLTTNPFTRFFTLKGAKQTLGINFDKNGVLTSSLDKPQFMSAMELLARELLLPGQPAEGTRLNTRAKPEEVFQKVFKGNRELESLLTRKIKQAKTKGPLSAKADNFFESLRCTIPDDQLINLTKEISAIDYRYFKTAASFLVRALLERTLDWCIQKYGLTKELMKEYNLQAKRNRDPGLDFKLDFCKKHHDRMFLGNVSRNFGQWKQIKDLNDLVIHGKWAQASVPSLEQAASTIRPFIKNIFNGTALQ